MSEIKWIKLATNIFDNRKIKLIESMPEGATMIVIWLKILCLAGNINDNGLIYLTCEIPYTDQMLATQFGVPLHVLQLAMNTFQSFEMIDIIDDVIHVSNWEKYQNIEGMKKVREQNRIRKQNQRAREKLLAESVMSRDSHATVTSSHATDIDIDIDIESISKDIDIVPFEEAPPPKSSKKKRRKFEPPTLEEVKAYCEERNNGVDPQRFFDYYSSQDWYRANGYKVADWKACMRSTWENGNRQQPRAQSNKSALDEIWAD